MPQTYKVEKREDHYYVIGLKDRHGDDTLILYDIPYPETETPEVTTPEEAEQMLGALYDMYQWHEGLREGDRFETPFGNFRCVSFHVVPE